MTLAHRILNLARGSGAVSILVTLSIAGAALAEGRNPNFALPPSELLDIMQNQPLEIVQVKRAGGVMGSRRIKVAQPDGSVLKLKWKKAPDKSIDGWNNSPRLEIAAWEVQKLVLDTQDYVVPPTTTRCLTLAEYEPVTRKPESSLRMANCVYGMLAGWLKDVAVPDRIWDAERFETDPGYAHNVANMNLVGYLIRHKDNRKGNVLISSQEGPSRYFLVDNGLAFGVWPSNFYSPISWHKIQVPSLPANSIARLRTIDRADLDRLAILVNMVVNGEGILVHQPTDQNLDPRKGLRIGDGQLQLGLTVKEIDAIEKRIAKLIGRIDSGKVATLGARQHFTTADGP